MEDTSEIYHSDEFDDSDDTFPIQNEDKPAYSEKHQMEGNLAEGTSSQNDMLKRADQPKDVIEDKSDKIIQQKCARILSADVPEFVPRYLKNNSYILNDISVVLPLASLEPVTNLPSLVEDKTVLPLHSCEMQVQTDSVHKIEKAVKMDIEKIDAFTQTEKTILPICNCQQTEEDLQNINKLLSVIDENVKLQKEMSNIREENEQRIKSLQKSSLQKFLESEKKIQVAETSAQISSIKLEACKGVFNNKIVKLEEQIKDQTNKIEKLTENNMLMNSIMMSQAIEYFLLQKNIVTCSITKSKNMISDLTNALSYFTTNSIPTVDDCNLNIKKWQDHLKEAESSLTFLNNSYEQTVKDIRLGNLEEISNFSKAFSQLAEPNDIIHDNYLTAIKGLYKENMQNLQQHQKFQMDYFQWWNTYGKFHQPRPAVVTAAPVYYNNVPLVGPPNMQITRAPFLPPVYPHQDAKSAEFKPPQIIEIRNLNLKSSTSNLNSKDNTNSSIKGSNQIITPMEEEAHQEHDKKFNTGTIARVNKQEANAISGKTQAEFATNSLKKDQQEYELTNIDNPVRMDQTCKGTIEVVPNLKSSFNPFSIASKSPILQRSVLNDSEEESDFDEASNCSFFNKINELATLPVSRDEEQNAVYYFNGDPNIENKENCLSFIVNKNSCISPSSSSNSIPIESRTDVHNHVTQQVLLEATKRLDFAGLTDPVRKQEPVEATKGVDYSQLPDAVRKAGKSFCNLYLHVIEEVPEKTHNEIFIALKRVRKKNIKLSGMTKDAIVAAVRIELKVDLKSDGCTVANPQEDKNSKNNCIFCLEPFGSLPLSELQCQHVFHKKCVSQWLIYKNECPVCRMLVI